MHQQTWIGHTHFNIGAKQEWKTTNRQCVGDRKETHLHSGWPILAAHPLKMLKAYTGFKEA